MILRLVLTILALGSLFALEIILGPGGLPDGLLFSLRLTRALLAVFVGASLSVSGAALQSLFQNPLADPYVLGTASGAALGYAVGFFFGLGNPGVLSVPAAAGAVGSLFVVYALSSVRGRLSGTRMLLAGVMVGFFASGLVAVFMILAKAEVIKTFYVLWGNLGIVLTSGDIPYLVVLATVILAGMTTLVLTARHLDALSLGETEALSLGVNVQALKAIIFVTTGIMVGLATSVVGAVGFVGLVVPHMARRLLSPRHSVLLLGSAMGGAILVLGSDLILRLAGFYQLPVGVITSLVGVPFFLYIMRTRPAGGGS
ncbi:MAG: FecCD family ABC transporter permease [candidate division WOR-3 bacterium]